MSLFDVVTDNISKVTDVALGEGSGIFDDLLNVAGNKIIDSMQNFPGANELMNLGFPQFELDMQSEPMQGGCDNYQTCCEYQPDGGQDPFDQSMDINMYIMDMCGGVGGNPMDHCLGGQEGYGQSIDLAMILASGNPSELLKLLLGNGGRGEGGGGGLFGDIFSGLKGILGGGGGEGGGGLFGGILGGILGGGGGPLGGVLGGILGKDGPLGGILGSIPGMETLLPLALKYGPLLL